MQDYIVIRANRKYIKVQLSDILFIQARKQYVRIFTPKGSWMTICRLKQIWKMLPADQFFQLHRSYIVALDKLTKVEEDAVHIDDVRIVVAVRCRKRYKNMIKKFRELR